MNGLLSVLPQRQSTGGIMPMLIPRQQPQQQTTSLTPTLQPRPKSVLPPDYKTNSTPTTKKPKSSVPPPGGMSKPSSEDQLYQIIQNIPGKREVVEYLQNRCNELTIKKNS